MKAMGFIGLISKALNSAVKKDNPYKGSNSEFEQKMAELELEQQEFLEELAGDIDDFVEEQNATEQEAIDQEEFGQVPEEGGGEFSVARLMLDTVFNDEEINEYNSGLLVLIIDEFNVQFEEMLEDDWDSEGFVYSRCIRQCIVLKYLIRKDLVSEFDGLSTLDDIEDVVDVIALSHSELIQSYFNRKIIHMGFKEFFDSLLIRRNAYETDEYQEPKEIVDQIKLDLRGAAFWLVECADADADELEDELT